MVIERDRAFNIAKNTKYDGYQRVFATVVYKFFDKETSIGAIKKETISNKWLAQDFHRPVIREFKKQKVYSPFTDNTWSVILQIYEINKQTY